MLFNKAIETSGIKIQSSPKMPQVTGGPRKRLDRQFKLIHKQHLLVIIKQKEKVNLKCEDCVI